MIAALDTTEVLARYEEAEAHGRAHVERVMKYCRVIARSIKDTDPIVADGLVEIDMEALELAAAYHDIARGKRSGGDHAEDGAKFAAEMLKGVIDESRLQVITSAIAEHNKPTRPTHIEGMILQDADKLDCLGAIGLLRVIEFHPAASLQEIIRELQNWNLEWAGMFWTEPGRRMAASRLDYMRKFIGSIYSELSEVEGGNANNSFNIRHGQV